MVTTECTEWETPIGNLQVDRETVQEIVSFAQEGSEFYGQVHYQTIDKKYEENEHSLEMHLPYIRKMFEARMAEPETDIKIVPLMVGQLEQEMFPKYARTLKKYMEDPKTLFVVSSDFCHWGKRFRFTHKFEEFSDDKIYESIEKLDRQAMQLIENQDL